MELNLEPKPVLAICLNPAWERTLYFKQYRPGAVNRAYKMAEHGGGKGVNSLRALRCLGVPAKVIGFSGGIWGENLKREVGQDGIWVEIEGNLRACFEIIDEAAGEVTEVIEPSPCVTGKECTAMLNALEKNIPEAGAAGYCGSPCNGINAEMIAEIVRIANKHNVPFLLDSVSKIDLALREKITVLKINTEEICALTKESDATLAAKVLQKEYPQLENIAITAGPEEALLFTRDGGYAYALPHLEHVISPIGAGDCATAIMLRRMSEAHFHIEDAFGEALACASASCLNGCPSVFEPLTAASILEKIRRKAL